MAEGVVARGKKTVVRRFQREDVDKRQRWPAHTDPLYSHNDPRPMAPRERDLWYLERTASSSYRMYAIDDLDGNLIGWITLRNVNPDAGSSVLGIALDPTKMDMGYGTDALAAFLEYYFESMGFREMWLDVAAFNRRAMRCYEKCGFRYVSQHWTEHPSSAFPPIFNDARYRNVAPFFRRSLLGIEVLYHDMVIDRASFLRQKAAMQGSDRGATRSADLPPRRAARH